MLMFALFSTRTASFSWRHFVASCALLTPLLSPAALTWKTQTIELNAKLGDLTAEGIFQFTNTGQEAVTIISVTPACGCTTTELTKNNYAPGETGEIKATFTIGERVGQQDKSIQVLASDSPTNPTTLTIRVNIPQRIILSPRLLLWNTKEPISEKSTLITANGSAKIAALDFAPDTNPLVNPRIEVLEAGVRYRLIFKPTAVDQAAQIPVLVTVRFADQTAETISLYVMIK